MFVEDLANAILWALPDDESLNEADKVRMRRIRDNAIRVGLEFAFTKTVRVAGEDHTTWSSLRPALKAMIANASGSGGAAALVSISPALAKEGLCNVLRRLGSGKQGSDTCTFGTASPGGGKVLQLARNPSRMMQPFDNGPWHQATGISPMMACCIGLPLSDVPDLHLTVLPPDLQVKSLVRRGAGRRHDDDLDSGL
jgi:hypothetical protein